MIEFAMFPPEINFRGGCMRGPGAGADDGRPPRLGTHWADDLYLAAAAYGYTVSDLTTSWLGPSSVSMATAAATYVSWITATAAEAALNRSTGHGGHRRLRGCVRHDGGRPPVIAANRALLLALVATNFFGQKHAGDHGHRGRIRRDVGAGCRGDVRLRPARHRQRPRLTPFTTSAGNHQPLWGGRDGPLR